MDELTEVAKAVRQNQNDEIAEHVLRRVKRARDNAALRKTFGMNVAREDAALQEAFGELITHLEERLVKLLYARLRDYQLQRNDIEDLLQEAILKVWKTLKNFNGNAYHFMNRIVHSAVNLHKDLRSKNETKREDVVHETAFCDQDADDAAFTSWFRSKLNPSQCEPSDNGEATPIRQPTDHCPSVPKEDLLFLDQWLEVRRRIAQQDGDHEESVSDARVNKQLEKDLGRRPGFSRKRLNRIKHDHKLRTAFPDDVVGNHRFMLEWIDMCETIAELNSIATDDVSDKEVDKQLAKAYGVNVTAVEERRKHILSSAKLTQQEQLHV